jgi:hypothetical protein
MGTAFARISVMVAATVSHPAKVGAQTVAEWRVSDTPIAKVVYDEGFGSIASAHFFRDGSIIVADPLSFKVIFFDSAGRFVRAIGRRGGGPAEFSNLRWARPYGSDSVATYDAAQRRISILDRTGRFGRSVIIRSPAEGLSPTAAAVTPDGHIIVGARRSITSEVPAGIHTLPLELWLYSPTGTPLSRIAGGLVGEEWVKVGTPGTLMMRPFASVSLVATGGGRVYIADSATYPIRALSAPSGSSLRITGSRATPAASQPYVAEYREQQLVAARQSGNQDAVIAQTKLLDGIPYPSSVPVLARLIVDTEGRLWAQDYPPPAWRRQTFALYNNAGTRVARITGPEGGRIVDAHGEKVLVIVRDPDDVRQIQVHRMR